MLTAAGRAVREQLATAEGTGPDEDGEMPATWAQPGVRISTPAGRGTVTGRSHQARTGEHGVLFRLDDLPDDEQVIAAASPYLHRLCSRCDTVGDDSMPARGSLCGYCAAAQDAAPAVPGDRCPGPDDGWENGRVAERAAVLAGTVTADDAAAYALQYPQCVEVRSRFERFEGEFRRSDMLVTVHAAGVEFPGRFLFDRPGWTVTLPTGTVSGSWGEISREVRRFVVEKCPAHVVAYGEVYERSRQRERARAEEAERIRLAAQQAAEAERAAAEQAVICVGDYVEYHGSLTEQHGRRLIALPCGWPTTCDLCEESDEAEHRWLLLDPEGGMSIAHARSTSITPVPGPQWPPRDAIPVEVYGYRFYGSHALPDAGGGRNWRLFFYCADGPCRAMWVYDRTVDRTAVEQLLRTGAGGADGRREPALPCQPEPDLPKPKRA